MKLVTDKIGSYNIAPLDYIEKYITIKYIVIELEYQPEE